MTMIGLILIQTKADRGGKLKNRLGTMPDKRIRCERASMQQIPRKRPCGKRMHGSGEEEMLQVQGGRSPY